MTESIKVVVIGGGYAGTYAANRLTRRKDVAVTLVNPRPDFVERIRLHQLATGSHDAVTDFGEILAPSIDLVVDSADHIDAPARTVALASGRSIAYDYLVYAVGSGTSGASVPEHAYPMASLEEASRLRAALSAAPAEAPVTVVGAGPTGIEMAAELGEQGRRVTLVCGADLGPFFHPRSRTLVAARFSELGVTVREGVSVSDVTEHAVRLDDGTEIPSEVTVWTAGLGVPDLATRSGLTTDAIGRLLTDETLTSVDNVRIVATGDAAAPSGVSPRMSCQASVQQGAGAADTVLARIAGSAPKEVAVGFVSHCLSLGRTQGFVEFTRRNDVAGPIHVGGRVAAGIKEAVCAGTVKQIGFEGRHPGLLTIPSWIGDPDRRRALAGTPSPRPVAAEQSAG